MVIYMFELWRTANSCIHDLGLFCGHTSYASGPLGADMMFERLSFQLCVNLFVFTYSSLFSLPGSGCS
jgi:hypothetical protein